jgi:hypothetical protein
MKDQEIKDLLKLNKLTFDDFIAWVQERGKKRVNGSYTTFTVWSFIREKNHKYVAFE